VNSPKTQRVLYPDGVSEAYEAYSPFSFFVSNEEAELTPLGAWADEVTQPMCSVNKNTYHTGRVFFVGSMATWGSRPDGGK